MTHQYFKHCYQRGPLKGKNRCTKLVRMFALKHLLNRSLIVMDLNLIGSSL